MPASHASFDRMVGSRIQAARKRREWSQEELTAAIGFKDRQTLSTIESGKRRVQADELIRFTQVLGEDISFFTDPYRIVEDCVFSWRADEEPASMEQQEDKARSVVAAYRRFKDLLGEPFVPLPHRLNLTRRNSFEEAALAGEQVASYLKMGDIPSLSLRSTIEQKLKIPVLFVELSRGISGAACRIPEAVLILINRNDPSLRQHFDMAHELFHVLTWDAMPPEHIDFRAAAPKRRSRIENLADNFAGGLLMPQTTLGPLWAKREEKGLDVVEWVKMAAEKLQVSGLAMSYRIKNLGWPSASDQEELEAADLTRSMRSDGKQRLYSEEFVQLIHRVLENGRVTRRKMAEILDCTIEDIEDLLADYQMAMPY